MHLKAENIFFLLMVLADLNKTVVSFDSKCPPLRLVSGRSRYQWRGRSVRFNCMRGFQLVGVKYATCMNGKWDADVPICVKYGCKAPSTTHVNGQFIESYRGAVVKIVCNPGYTLIGSPSVYCNGIRWNETFPVCRVKNTNPALSCDFEDPGLCGWSQDPMHDLDWKRQNGSTFSGDTGTGLLFDHTTGNNTGYYMYLDSSSPRVENETARLYSPVYPPEYSNGTCFKFWYLMNGATTGFLKIYVKSEGVELFNVIPSFWINGDQGKIWNQSFFLIEPTESPFQIVVEGVRGPGAVGDTAFDDVKLTSSDECSILEDFSSPANQDDDVVDFFSCKNRCNQGRTNGTGVGPDEDKCNCYETCDRDGTCCSDYFDFCSVFPSTSPPTTTRFDMKISSSISPSLPIEPEEKLFTSKSTPKTSTPLTPPLNFNNESNEIDPKKPFGQHPFPNTPNRTANEIPRRNPTPRYTFKTTTRQPQPVISTLKNVANTRVGTSVSVRKTTQRKISVEVTKPQANKTKATANATSNRISPMEVQPKVGGNAKNEVFRNITVTLPVSTTTAKVLKNSKPNNIKLTFPEKPSSPNLSNESRFNKGRQKEVSGKDSPQAIKIDKQNENGGINVQKVIEVGSAALSIIIVIILGIFWYKRKETRKAERENMVEDSDSILYEMDSSTLGSESHSLVCIRPGGLQQ